MAIQLQTARDSFARYKHDISDVDNTQFIEWCDFLNKFAYRYLQGIDPDRFIEESSYTVSSSPSSQALPADFDSMQPLGCGIYEVDDSGDDTSKEITQTGHGRRDQGFYFEQGNVVFTGFDGTSKTLKMRYIKNITALTAITDYLTVEGTSGGLEIIPDEYLQYVIYAWIHFILNGTKT